MEYNEDYEYSKNDDKIDDKLDNDNENEYIDYERKRMEYLDYLYEVFNDLNNDIKFKFPLSFLKNNQYCNFIDFISQ